MEKLILFGSSCIYPKNLNKPIKESQLMTGLLEKTNESYAVAKIAGIKMISLLISNTIEIIFALCPVIYLVQMIIMI